MNDRPEVRINGVLYVPVSEAHINARALEDALVGQWAGDNWRTEYPDSIDHLQVIVTDGEEDGEPIPDFIARILAAAERASGPMTDPMTGTVHCEVCGHERGEHMAYNENGLLTVNHDDAVAWGRCTEDECRCGGMAHTLHPDHRRLRAENEQLRAALDDCCLRYIEATNPGIDLDEVRRMRGQCAY